MAPPCSQPSRWSNRFRACGARLRRAKRFPRKHVRAASARGDRCGARRRLAVRGLHELSAAAGHSGAAAGFASRLRRWRASRASRRSGSRPISARSKPARSMARGSSSSGSSSGCCCARGAPGRCAVCDGGGTQMPRGRDRHRRARRQRRPHRDAPALARRARRWRARPAAAPSRRRCAERGAHALAASQPRRARPTNLAASAAPLSSFRSP